jgi:A/G-specific adenine glycosylase
MASSPEITAEAPPPPRSLGGSRPCSARRIMNVPPRWSVAVMELGALVCTADRPHCASCPVVSTYAWHLPGSPTQGAGEVPRRSQPYEGTDRQCQDRLDGAS